MTYQRSLPPISQADAEQEPADDRLFSDPAPTPTYPHLTLQTTVIDPDGFTWSVTFTDTPLAAAAAVLKKRGCVPASAPQAAAPAPATNGSTGNGSSATPPTCPVHGKPMKPMQHADKAGRTHWCTQKVGDDYCQERS